MKNELVYFKMFIRKLVFLIVMLYEASCTLNIDKRFNETDSSTFHNSFTEFSNHPRNNSNSSSSKYFVQPFTETTTSPRTIFPIENISHINIGTFAKNTSPGKSQLSVNKVHHKKTGRETDNSTFNALGPIEIKKHSNAFIEGEEVETSSNLDVLEEDKSSITMTPTEGKVHSFSLGDETDKIFSKAAKDNLLTNRETEPSDEGVIMSGHLTFIDKLLEKYDKRAWPTYGTNRPTIVTVNININSLGSISAANMDFGMDIYLRQSWIDPRLKSGKFGINNTVTLNGEDLIDRIWKPDIFFRNLKSGHFHTLTVPNKLVKLSPNGHILFSMRLTLRLSCQMKFHLYPLDTQRCWVVLGSYAQTADQVLIKWREDSPITLEKEIEVPEFHAILQERGTFWRDIDTGVFSFLNVSFVFIRQNGFHLVQTYLPTFLIVVMSWVSFWVPVEAAPARVTLGVTTSLSLTTVASGIRSQLPPVSYLKAIDIWMGACSVMVFAALLEFALASYLLRMKICHGKSEYCCFMWNNRSESDGKNQNVVQCPDEDKKIQRRRSLKLDRLSRMIFPAIFLFFNTFYWIYYLSQCVDMKHLFS